MEDGYIFLAKGLVRIQQKLAIFKVEVIVDGDCGERSGNVGDRHPSKVLIAVEEWMVAMTPIEPTAMGSR